MSGVGMRADVSRFLAEGLDYIFMENLKKGADAIFKKCSTNMSILSAVGTYDGYGNLPTAQVLEEGDEIVYNAFEQAYQTTVTNDTYAVAFKMSNRELKDQLYKEVLARAKNNELGKSIISKQNEDIAAIWDAVFTSTGADGVYYASASHPLVSSTSLNDNLADSSVITPDAIIAAKNKFNGVRDYAGKLMDTMPDAILCHANQEATVLAILQSTLKAQENSNTKNTVPSLRPIFNKYLSEAPWHILDTSIPSVIWQDRSGMESYFNQDEIATLNWYYNASINGKAAQINPGFGHVSSLGV